jgi:hypothetical protein
MSDARIGQHFGQQFQPIVAVRAVPGMRTIEKTAGQAMCGPLRRRPERLYETDALSSELRGLVPCSWPFGQLALCPLAATNLVSSVVQDHRAHAAAGKAGAEQTRLRLARRPGLPRRAHSAPRRPPHSAWASDIALERRRLSSTPPSTFVNKATAAAAPTPRRIPA